MDASIVRRKTNDGQAELEVPQRGLGTVARQLLILIDGKRSIADLSLLRAGHGEIYTSWAPAHNPVQGFQEC